jgi:hypothetical protein
MPLGPVDPYSPGDIGPIKERGSARGDCVISLDLEERYNILLKALLEYLSPPARMVMPHGDAVRRLTCGEAGLVGFGQYIGDYPYLLDVIFCA